MYKIRSEGPIMEVATIVKLAKREGSLDEVEPGA